MLTLVALAALLAPGPARAAPPSSAMSNPELAPPQIPVKTKEVTRLYRCTGYYNSYDCTTVLYLDDCKHSISVSWGPLQVPGTLEWARLHRNWCSITYDSAEYREERKLEPEKCDGLMRLFAAAFQGFPEVRWQDAKCTNISAPDGILYESQHYHAPGHPDFFHNPLPDPDPAPQAIRLEDVRSCELHYTPKKRRYVRCPVLVPLVNSWLRKFLAFVDVAMVIQNKQTVREDSDFHPPSTYKSSKSVWRGSLIGGVTFANVTNYKTIAASNIAVNTNNSDQGSLSPLFGVELTFQPTSLFGLGAIIEWSQYNYVNTTPQDQQLALLIMPRIQKTFTDQFDLWLGLGGGLLGVLPGANVITVGTGKATIDNSVGFALSPRFGMDFRTTNTLWLGFEILYMYATGDFSGSGTNADGSAAGTVSEDFTRAWWGFAAKASWEL